jgi:hypothetical protein
MVLGQDPDSRRLRPRPLQNLSGLHGKTGEIQQPLGEIL